MTTTVPDYKAMREALKSAGYSVPRANDDVLKMYNAAVEMDALSKENVETAEDKLEAEAENGPEIPDRESVANSEEEDGELWTYIGAGENPPSVINFMGVESFLRGQPKRVTEEEVLKKLRVNPSFVAGRVEPEFLVQRDTEAAAIAKAKRDEDLKIQLASERQNAR